MNGPQFYSARSEAKYTPTLPALHFKSCLSFQVWHWEFGLDFVVWTFGVDTTLYLGPWHNRMIWGRYFKTTETDR